MILEKLKTILSEQFDVDESEITLETNIYEDLEADSLDLVELIMELEKRYDIKIPQEDQEKIKNVADAAKYIEDHKK